MDNGSDQKLDQLLGEAFPLREVSPDFTLKLWHGLMKLPSRPPWWTPAPLVATAAALGIFLGVWNWSRWEERGALFPASFQGTQTARLEMFGNAPVDTLAGSYLKLRMGG